MTDERPLIWTSKGNLPIEDLDYEAKWRVEDDAITFAEIYKLNGEVVKESAHVLTRQQLHAPGEAGQFG